MNIRTFHYPEDHGGVKPKGEKPRREKPEYRTA
jgi:hypothetical protein